MINDAVLILMATYNGEKYLSDQLESIINQTNKNWKLIVQVVQQWIIMLYFRLFLRLT